MVFKKIYNFIKAHPRPFKVSGLVALGIAGTLTFQHLINRPYSHKSVKTSAQSQESAPANNLPNIRTETGDVNVYSNDYSTNTNLSTNQPGTYASARVFRGMSRKEYERQRNPKRKVLDLAADSYSGSSHVLWIQDEDEDYFSGYFSNYDNGYGRGYSNSINAPATPWAFRGQKFQ